MPAYIQNTDSLLKKIQSPPIDRIAEIEDFVDFIRERTKDQKKTTTNKKKTLNFPVISVGKWLNDLSLRREDMYDDNGR